MSNNSEPSELPCPPGKHVMQSDHDCYTCGWHVGEGDCSFGRPLAREWEGPYAETPW